jgi:hypothetical protein
MKLILLLLSTCGLALPLLTPVAAASASIVAQAYLTVGCTGNAASTTYTADECLPAEEHGLSVKHFCTDQYHYEVDYSDAACANAIRIVRTRIGECHAGQMSQCSNSAAGPAFPLTFPVDGWVYSTNYYKTDRSAAGCPLTSTASAPLSDTRQVSLQMGACLPSVSDQKSIIYACANNGANFGGM